MVDVDTICTTFTVPADFVSGGTIVARLTAASTNANVETWDCQVTLDGGALGSVSSGTIANQTAVQNSTSTPLGTGAAPWVAGASMGAVCSIAAAVARDDVQNIHSIEAQYTATE